MPPRVMSGIVIRRIWPYRWVTVWSDIGSRGVRKAALEVVDVRLARVADHVSSTRA